MNILHHPMKVGVSLVEVEVVVPLAAGVEVVVGHSEVVLLVENLGVAL